MSLILDALRKSERTRQQTLAGQVSATDTPPAHTRIPVPWATLIGLLLIANVIVLGIIFWRSHAASHTPAAATPTAGPASQAPAPVYRPEVRSLAAEAAAATTSAAPAPSAASQPALNTLATQSAVVNPAGPRAAVTTAAPANASGSSVINLNGNNPPPLDTLPLAFQQSLPALHLDVHSYSQNPAERFVIINMQRYQKGDTLKEGPKVIAIVADGVILEYQGQQFLLPRP
ncbi:MAG: general secretion pathway protein GspB [Gammaproteobacteria bacterium]|nr:general secretion pathway protein GspB [Gammaproteobacteria bacterium]MBU6510535.1 general secretion pathway protein GspB [Gammaproteobacteria bacterium]MDE1983847.1 general secretion pathway protein GspB [Gammaproteobacteria bacterium]MDE2107979.1 general secretion pathway protein GspB [Gammaproteobacteria bacterium]MDE2460734.1 general secretion pathway protein GspB [Gammaproteobacteria bacterium]